MRQPRLAEMVAGVLRERIVNDDLGGADGLPGLDRLVEEFGVSRPSVREALRVLEKEGLITVRRGNIGGAVVHRPTPDVAAYTFGLVLQAEEVTVSDLAAALGQMEVLCAGLCALRSDRRRAVVPKLRGLHREAERCLEDAVAFELACQHFHDGIVSLCGNRSIELAVTAMSRLWREQPEGWAHRVATLHQYPEAELRRSGLDAHAAIMAAIEAGDTEQAGLLTSAHIRHPSIRQVAGSRTIVRATEMTFREG